MVVLCRMGSGWSVESDGADWLSRRVCCYPLGYKQCVKKGSDEKYLFKVYLVRRERELNFAGPGVQKRCDKRSY